MSNLVNFGAKLMSAVSPHALMAISVFSNELCNWLK
jgi:hypothetical protein